MMKRWLKNTALALSLSLPIGLSAELPLPSEGSYVRVSAGKRQDLLKWSISAPEGSAQNITKLKWHPIKIAEAKVEGCWLACNGLYVRASAFYGRIYSGSNTAKDYPGGGISQPTAYLKAGSGRGNVHGLSVGCGWRFYFCDCAVALAPVVGYSRDEQRPKSRGGIKIHDAEGTEENAFHSRHSSYRAKWSGPWIGMDWNYQVLEDWDLHGTAEYHWARYNGSGKFNLRNGFPENIRQQIDHANGYHLEVGANYFFWSGYYIGIDVLFDRFKGRDGKARVYGADQDFGAPFRKVQWKSWAVLGTVGWQY